MKSIFISASVQDKQVTEAEGLRPIEGTEISNALVACAEIMSGKYELIWGGHPAISSLLAKIFEDIETVLNPVPHRVFQSDYFQRGELTLNFVYTPKLNSRASSLTHMREKMLDPEIDYVLGVFMGGRKAGLSEEIALFRQNHPNALVLALPKTGGYAEEYFRKNLINDCKIENAELIEDVYKSCKAGRYFRLFALVLKLLKSSQNHQRKCFFTDEGDKRICQYTNSGTILPMPYYDNLIYVKTVPVKEKIMKSMCQISFIVTNKRGNILTVQRDSPDRSTKGKTILFSMLPTVGESERMCRSHDDALLCLRTKITEKAFNSTPELQFLGLVKNHLQLRNSTYYFYLFEARFEDIEEFDIENKREILRKTAGKDHNDEIVDFETFESILGEIVQSKNDGDKAAFKLLANFRGLDVDVDCGSASYIYSPHQYPFERVYDSYFISHATSDYERYVKPFLKVLDEEKIPYWVHEIDAKQNTDWDRSNKIVLSMCRGVISIESSKSILRKHVREEMSLAVQTRKNCSAYSIRRFFCESFDLNSRVTANLNDSHLAEFLKFTGIPVNTTNASDIRLALEDLIKEYRHST